MNGKERIAVMWLGDLTDADDVSQGPVWVCGLPVEDPRSRAFEVNEAAWAAFYELVHRGRLCWPEHVGYPPGQWRKWALVVAAVDSQYRESQAARSRAKLWHPVGNELPF